MAAERRLPHGPPGIPIDSSGGATIDPTKNVLDLVQASGRRTDDMAILRAQIAALENAQTRALQDLNARHQGEMAAKESSRVDSLRTNDREEASRAQTAANLAITTLATSTANLKDTLQAQVQATAAAVEQRSAAREAETNKRFSIIEAALSEGRGKQAYADPQQAEMLSELRNLARSRDTTTGAKETLSEGMKLLLTIAAMLLGLFYFVNRAPAAAPPVYLSAPPGTMLPTPQTPPASVR